MKIIHECELAQIDARMIGAGSCCALCWKRAIVVEDKSARSDGVLEVMPGVIPPLPPFNE